MPADFVMLSGGLDSSCMAFILAKGHRLNLRAIYVDHGQRAARHELQASHEIAAALGIPLKVIDATGLWPSFRDIAEPNHVHIMTSSDRIGGSPAFTIAAAYASLAGATKLYAGIVKDDLDGRPWLVDMIRHYQEAVRVSKPSTTGFPPGKEDFSNFSIETPVSHLSKAELIRQATALGAPLEKTWSCQFSNIQQCGSCWICSHRKAAFSAASTKDLTSYTT